jgi:hypothetical protein
LNVPTTVEEVTAFFSLGKPKAGRAHLETQEVLNVLVDKELPLIKRALNKIRLGAHSTEGRSLHAKDIADLLFERISPIIELNADDKELLFDALKDAKDILKLPDVTKFLVGPNEVLPIQSSTRVLETIISNPHTRLVTKEGKVTKIGLFEALTNVAADLHNSESDVYTGGEFMGMNYSTTHAQYMETIERMLRAKYSRACLECVKTLQFLVQGSAHERILVASSAISDSLVKLQLGKWDIPFQEMFMGLISISRDIGSLPLASVKYTRVIDTERRGFTDGTLIRLWKALSGIAQGTKRLPNNNKPQANKPGEIPEFKGWW